MAEKIDIFKGKEKEIKANFESRGFDWEKMKAKLEKVSINEKLDSLGQNFENLEANSDAHIKVLENLLGNLEQFKREKGIVDKAKQKAKEEFQKKKDEKFKELRGLANKAAPFGIGGAIFDWAIGLIDGNEEKEDDWGFKKFFKKIGMGIGLFFIGKLCGEKAYEKWKSMKFGEEEKDEELRIEEEVKGVKESQEINDKIDTKIIGYSTLGSLYLKKISFTGILFDRFNDYTSIKSKILENKDLSFKKLRLYYEKLSKNQDKETFEKIKKDLGLSGENIGIKQVVGTLYIMVGQNAKISFEKIDIDKILEKESFKKSFGNIYDIYKGKDILDIPYEVSLFLLGYSLPIGVVKTASNLASFLPSFSDLADGKNVIEGELEVRKEEFFSAKFIKLITLNNNCPDFHSGKLFKKLEGKIEKETDKDIREKLELELDKFMRFTSFVIGNLENNKKINIVDSFKKDYIEKITPMQMLNFYMIFNGKINFDNLSGIDKTILYSYISEIPGNKGLRNAYLSEIIDKSIGNNIAEPLLEDVDLSFIKSILGDTFFNNLLKKSADFAGSKVEATNMVVVESLKSQGIELPKKGGNYDYMDYVILGVLLGGNFLVSKMPLPLHIKVVAIGLFSTGGSAYLYGVLAKKGVIDKMIADNTLDPEVISIIKNLKKEYGEEWEESDGDFVGWVKSLF